MAGPNSNFTEVVVTTLRNRAKSIADNVSNGNALLQRLSQKGNISMKDGGRTIVRELDYAENATFSYYTGFETLNVAASDVLTAAEYPWKQANVNVVGSGLETVIQNSGANAILDLLEARIRNAERTAKNNIAQGIYSDGTGSNGKEITGLRAQVNITPTSGIVGGINRASQTFWRNQTSGDIGEVFASSAVLESEMADMWIECSRGGDKPDLLVGGQIPYKAFWLSLLPIQRITDPGTAVRGFETLKYVTADVVLDHDSGILASAFYFLNTDYLFWDVHSARNFTVQDKREPVNQDAFVVPLLFAGNLTMSNASLQGVIFT
jgi:hypothetical protein